MRRMEKNFGQKEEIERFSVSVPKDIFEAFEDMRKKIDISRSQAIRNAMHLFIEKETQNLESGNQEHAEKITLGTIYLLMKHSDWGITHDHQHEEPHIFSDAPHHSHPNNEILKDQKKDSKIIGIENNTQKDQSQGQDTHGFHTHQKQIYHESTKKHEESEEEHLDLENKIRYINVIEADVLKNMEIQHEFHDVIVSVTHIHAEHDLCLETLVVKGKISRIHALYSKLQKLRSVIDVRLFIALSHQG